MRVRGRGESPGHADPVRYASLALPTSVPKYGSGRIGIGSGAPSPGRTAGGFRTAEDPGRNPRRPPRAPPVHRRSPQAGRRPDCAAIPGRRRCQVHRKSGARDRCRHPRLPRSPRVPRAPSGRRSRLRRQLHRKYSAIRSTTLSESCVQALVQLRRRLDRHDATHDRRGLKRGLRGRAQVSVLMRFSERRASSRGNECWCRRR